jgi:putative oxidoreductase
VNTIQATAPKVERGMRLKQTAELTRYLVPLGRLMLVAIFLSAVPMHFARSGIDYAASQGVPMANVLVPISGVLALLGGLSVLFGYQARVGAVLLLLFLVPVTLMMHKFWGLTDPHQVEMQRIMFMKNVAILGGILMVVHFGAGPISIDERSSSTPR